MLYFALCVCHAQMLCSYVAGGRWTSILRTFSQSYIQDMICMIMLPIIVLFESYFSLRPISPAKRHRHESMHLNKRQVLPRDDPAAVPVWEARLLNCVQVDRGCIAVQSLDIFNQCAYCVRFVQLHRYTYIWFHSGA